METPEVQPDGRLPHYRGVVPYSDLNSRDAIVVGAFARSVDALLGRVASLSNRNQTREEWAETLYDLTETFLRIPADRPEEFEVRQSLFLSFEKLELLEGVEKEGISFAVFRQFVEAHLENLPSQQGRLLTGGVTFSAMRPLRPIPFRIVYILGLEEGSFPGSEEDSTLDLRQRKRELGDVTAPEANRYLFLETLMVTGEKLYLTYPNLDLQKDREIAPCSVIEELKRVARDRLKEGELREISIPISASSETYLEPLPDWTDARVNFSERDRLLCLLELREVGRLDPQVDSELMARTNRILSEESQIRGGAVEVESERTIRLNQLRQFLINPLESTAQSELGLQDEEDEDAGLKEDEPFYSEFPSDYEILSAALSQSILMKAAGEESDPGDFLKNLYEGKSLCGEVPSDFFGDLDREGFESTLDGIIEEDAGGVSMPTFLNAVRGFEFFPLLQIGESNERVEGTRKFPPLTLSVEGSQKEIEVTLHGTLPLVWRGDESLFTLQLAPTSSPPDAIPSKQVLVPYLVYLTLLALKRDSGEPFVGNRSLVVGVQYKDRLKVWKYCFTPEEACHRLQCLLEDYLNLSFETLPLQAFSGLGKGESKKVMDLLRASDESPESTEAFQIFLEERLEALDGDQTFREMELVQLLGAMPPANGFEVCRRRLLPFLNGEPIEDLSELNRGAHA